MKKAALLIILPLLMVQLCLNAAAVEAQKAQSLYDTVRELSSFGSRVTGSAGYEKAADYIEERLKILGLDPRTYLYELPVRRFRQAELTFNGEKHSLTPFINNAVTPQTTDGVISAPLFYVGKGSLDDLDGKAIENSIVLMDFSSARNWQLLPALGAKAVIFLQDESSQGRIFFREKEELTPLQFPCFYMTRDKAELIFGSLVQTNNPIATNVELQARTDWEKYQAKNIYALIDGTDPKLKNELLIVEAFYDNEEFVVGTSPGADASTSIATLLDTAAAMVSHPQKRSILVVATSGQAQTLAGMRDMIWSLNARSKDLRDQGRQLKKSIKNTRDTLQLLNDVTFPMPADSERDALIAKAVKLSINQAVDQVTRHLMQLRLGRQNASTRDRIQKAASERQLYRRLGWAATLHNLPEKEATLLQQIIPQAIIRYERLLADAKQQQGNLKSAAAFRTLVREYNVAAIVSLHLSSHGNGVGGFHQGWLYNLKQTINRTSIFSPVAELLESVAGDAIGRARYQDSLRPSHQRSWDSWFLDQPSLGGEVSNVAGYLGLSLVTTGDGRNLWGTPSDTIDRIDVTYLEDQARLIQRLLLGLAGAQSLQSRNAPRDGFVTATARTNLLLQGELFANFPARNSVILAYQGLKKYYAMVDESGYFTIKGLADKKHVLDKLIIEGYRFDEESGRVLWAIDKKETGKANYRLKLLRKSMKTDLVMFNCHQTTIFDLLEPRSFAYMTKLQLYDGRRDAPPEHYWYSRIDTRDSIMASIYSESGTLLKMTLSDTVLTNKMILTNGTEERKMGLGYPVEEYPAIINTNYRSARDAWTLLAPRIENLESHGIYDNRINDLKTRGETALSASSEGFDSLDYSVARVAAAKALALAARVYTQIEKTQKDVLFGVLFYIALFVPFAFVMERFLFNFNNIYKRIVGFSVILVLLIAIIYNVHPAFELAYSPMVVILAFFIIGLSFMVTLIIFFRFEDEMILLQRRASNKRAEEISRWKAFVAAFFLGVSNLRRRRMRTILTATTLIILTFTIMSFTTIKSSQQQVRLLFQPKAPYLGILLKRVNHQSMPPQATDILVNSMGTINRPAPRVWLEAKDPARPVAAPLRKGTREISIQGLIGLSPNEAAVTGLDKLLTTGRWFIEDDRTAIILEEQMAHRLGVTESDPDVFLWGSPFTVIGTFQAERFEQAIDLDGEPLTPVIFPEEAGTEISEEEMEALESGDDVRSFQGRYRHIAAGQTAIIPAETLLAAGGKLKNIAVRPDNAADVKKIASELSDRFSLAIFTGEEDGVWLYNISDTMNYSGVPNIIIPLLISVLIVLNTMISSVYERKGEIAVYTSVGLAPSHVGFLFVAEAMALAVVSVVIGYLVAQVSAAVLSTSSLWSGITVNYSSLAGVAAMVLVIAVVLISVIYPARVAARIAIPDVNRTFELPAPVDNRIEVTLPFLMKYQEHESIGGFIFHYLASHRDVSHGIFSTGQLHMVFSCSTVDDIIEMVNNSDVPQEVKCLHIRANVWLAPFDFGIMQTVDLQFCPASEGHEFLEIKIGLRRLSGESGVWQRINTSFLHEVRKQLLVWRSFDDDAHRVLKLAFRQIIAESQHDPEAV